MTGVLEFLLGYAIWVLIWFIINLFLFSLSYLFKKNISAFSLMLTTIIDLGVALYLVGYSIYILYLIVIAREWLILVFVFLLSGLIISFWSMVYEFVLLPFKLIGVYFTTKAEELIEKSNHSKAYSAESGASNIEDRQVEKLKSFCSSCGSANNSEAVYCKFCGNKLN